VHHVCLPILLLQHPFRAGETQAGVVLLAALICAAPRLSAVTLNLPTSREGYVTLSKDFVGRALFNCVVLGKRIEMSPEAAKKLLEEKARRGK